MLEKRKCLLFLETGEIIYDLSELSVRHDSNQQTRN